MSHYQNAGYNHNNTSIRIASRSLENIKFKYLGMIKIAFTRKLRGDQIRGMLAGIQNHFRAAI
jgi:hypothetical protein